MRMLRWISGKTKKDWVKSEDIRDNLEVTPITGVDVGILSSAIYILCNFLTLYSTGLCLLLPRNGELL